MPIYEVKIKRRSWYWEEARLVVEADSITEAVEAADTILESEDGLHLDWVETGVTVHESPSAETAEAIADESDDEIIEEGF